MLFRLDVSHWYVVRAVFVMAGLVSASGLLCAYVTSNPWWLAVNALVALMQLFFAFTGWCPSAILIHKLGISEK